MWVLLLPDAGMRCGMSFRLAAYAVCIEDRRVLLARYVSPTGESIWTRNWIGVGGRHGPFTGVGDGGHIHGSTKPGRR
jgi:hypothetical protein